MKRTLATLLLLTPFVAFAQFSPNGVESLTLTLSPEFPRPNSQAVITPQSSLLDLANSTMKVSVNGKTIYSGATQAVGVSVGAAGQTTSVSVSVTAAGRTYSKSLSITPSDVSLVIEPIATAPALYAGKPVIPEGGSVRVVAIPDFRTGPTTRIDPNTLSYTWTLDGTTLIGASGIGRSAVTLSSPLQYRSQTISVLVQSRDGSLRGGDSFSITPQKPVLRVYVQDPLQGPVFDTALEDSYTISEAEKTFVAVPYGLSQSAGGPEINWFLDGSPAQSGPQVTLRPEGGGRGSALLSVTAKGSGSADILNSSLSITFGATSRNIFGL